MKIGTQESKKIIIVSLDSEKTGPYRSIPCISGVVWSIWLRMQFLVCVSITSSC